MARPPTPSKKIRPLSALPQNTQLKGTSDDDRRFGRTSGQGSGHPIQQPRVRRQSCEDGKLLQPRPKAREAADMPRHIEPIVETASKQPSADGGLDRLVCQVVVGEIFLHGRDERPTPTALQADAAVSRRGSKVNQQTVRTEDSVGFLEGMDHAPGGKASEGPGEDDNVEGPGGPKVQPPGRPDGVLDLPSVRPGQRLAGDADGVSVRIDGDDLGAEPGQAAGQPTVAASNFEDPGVSP